MMEPLPNFINAEASPVAECLMMDGNTDERVAVLKEPVLLDGILYLPSSGFRIITPNEAENQAALIALCLVNLGDKGLAIALSATQLRLLSGTFNRIADLLETRAADEANAALAKAAGK